MAQTVAHQCWPGGELLGAQPAGTTCPWELQTHDCQTSVSRAQPPSATRTVLVMGDEGGAGLHLPPPLHLLPPASGGLSRVQPEAKTPADRASPQARSHPAKSEYPEERAACWGA